jgi:hypothetical protein
VCKCEQLPCLSLVTIQLQNTMPNSMLHDAQVKITMPTIIDSYFGDSFVDVNVLHRTGGPEDAAVDEILKLRDEGRVALLLPASARAEITHAPREVQVRAALFICPEHFRLSGLEQATYEGTLALIQGSAASHRHSQYALQLVESGRYEARYFISNDECLLTKASEIRQKLRVAIVKPTEFLAAYRAYADWPASTGALEYSQ